jgi:hypothetical protein
LKLLDNSLTEHYFLGVIVLKAIDKTFLLISSFEMKKANNNLSVVNLAFLKECFNLFL